MIRHPLIRCVIFIVAVVLWYSLLGPFGHSFNTSVLANAGAVFAATATMLALDRRGPRFIGLSLDAGWWQQALAGVACGGASIVAAALPMLAAGYVHWSAAPFDPGHWALMAGLFLIAATSEELLFRGYGFQRMVEGIGAVPALLVLAVFFGVAHADNPNHSWPGVANTMLVGLVFGVAFLRTGRLWLPIGWHWAWNLTEASLGFPVSGIRIEGMPVQTLVSGRQLWTGAAYGPEGSLPVTLVLLVSLILVLRLGQVRGKAVQENAS
jgi:membrane protease YdiL (CAAX protease family)